MTPDGGAMTEHTPPSRPAPAGGSDAAPPNRTAARPRRVAVGGLPYFGRRMAALLDGDDWQAAYLETRGWRPVPALRALLAVRRADVLYQLGGQLARRSRPDALLTAVRRPCVMHWTGSDVLYARGMAARGRVSARLRDGCVHLAGAPWLVDELRALGVDAAWQPHSAVAAPAHLPDFPATFTVLAYLRPGRERFYGLEAVLAVAAAVPEARVLVVGCARLPVPAPPNVRCLGWVEDVASIYARTHVLLRLTAHDGLAFMVQEALAYGRHVVWNYPFPAVCHVTRADEAPARVAALAAHHRQGTLALNHAGADHVRERYHPRRIRDELRARLAAALEAGR
jgi:hypothetical protein